MIKTIHFWNGIVPNGALHWLSSTFHCLATVKHSKSFAVANTDGSSIEELKETARRLTSDSSFRESVYKIMARKDATNIADVWEEIERGKRRETVLSFTSVSESPRDAVTKPTIKTL